MPVFRQRASLPASRLLDVPGLGISSQCREPAGGGGLYSISELAGAAEGVLGHDGWIPSNTTFDTSVMTDAAVRSMWENWGLKANISNVTNVMPGQFYERAADPTEPADRCKVR